MKKNKAIDTGYGIPVNKAMGMLYPKEQRIYNDPFSEKILSGFGKWFIKLMYFPWFHRFITN